MHFPSAIPPSFSIAIVKGESSLSMEIKDFTPPLELDHPFLESKKSFNPKGTPAKGPTYSPLEILSSISFAFFLASSSFR